MATGVKRSFTLAFTMRSGSNAICDLLRENGLGNPGEWFQNSIVARPDVWRDKFLELVEQYQCNGIFGSKMAVYHRLRVDDSLRRQRAGYRVIDDILPDHRWVRLVRRDKILQAVSLWRAESSGHWATVDDEHVPAGSSQYDFFQVMPRLICILTDEMSWDLYFAQQQIRPYLIVYEDFFSDPEKQLHCLVEFLGGLPPGRMAISLNQNLRIQRDQTSYSLRNRFMADIELMNESESCDEFNPAFRSWVHFLRETMRIENAFHE